MEVSGNSERSTDSLSPVVTLSVSLQKSVDGLSHLWCHMPVEVDVSNFSSSPNFSTDHHSGSRETDLWISTTTQTRRVLQRACWMLPCWWPMRPSWKLWWSKDLLSHSTSRLLFSSACHSPCKLWWEYFWYSLVCSNSKNHRGVFFFNRMQPVYIASLLVKIDHCIWKSLPQNWINFPLKP